MLYLEETFNLSPASPETLDKFIEKGKVISFDVWQG